MMRAHSFLLLTAVLLAVACRRGSVRGGDPQGGDTLRLKYSTLLTIVRHQGYTDVAVANPWKTGRVLHRYRLVPAGRPLPAGDDPAVTVVSTPIERASVFTTVHCALLTQLGVGERIVGVADLKYIKIPYIHERVRQGHIIDCGNGLSPVVEKIIDQRPDAILLSPFENSGGYGRVEQLGIPLIECAEYMESSPLARAEWMRFYGMLFGRERQADSLFAVVDSSYQALTAVAARAGTGRSVVIDKMAGSVWYVPGGRSTLGRMVADAGGAYPWTSDGHSGSLALPFETVLERGGDSDVWLLRYSAPHALTLNALLADHQGYSQMRAFRRGEVYGCNVDRSPFYEESPFRPDWLLADFISIVHPELSQLPPLRYFHQLK